MALADHLHKTIAEVEEITLDEYNEWVAYFAVQERLSKKRGAK